MILGMTVTIPDPSSISLPDFKPLWAWIAGGVGSWYLLAALIFRIFGVHRRNVAEFNLNVEKIKAKHADNSAAIDEQLQKLNDPSHETATMLATSPLLLPVTFVFLFFSAFGWLAGIKQSPTTKEDKQ